MTRSAPATILISVPHRRRQSSATPPRTSSSDNGAEDISTAARPGQAAERCRRQEGGSPQSAAPRAQHAPIHGPVSQGGAQAAENQAGSDLRQRPACRVTHTVIRCRPSTRNPAASRAPPAPRFRKRPTTRQRKARGMARRSRAYSASPRRVLVAREGADVRDPPPWTRTRTRPPLRPCRARARVACAQVDVEDAAFCTRGARSAGHVSARSRAVNNRVPDTRRSYRDVTDGTSTRPALQHRGYFRMALAAVAAHEAGGSSINTAQTRCSAASISSTTPATKRDTRRSPSRWRQRSRAIRVNAAPDLWTPLTRRPQSEEVAEFGAKSTMLRAARRSPGFGVPGVACCASYVMRGLPGNGGADRGQMSVLVPGNEEKATKRSAAPKPGSGWSPRRDDDRVASRPIRYRAKYGFDRTPLFTLR
jgi:hypothetical protein